MLPQIIQAALWAVSTVVAPLLFWCLRRIRREVQRAQEAWANLVLAGPKVVICITRHVSRNVIKTGSAPKGSRPMQVKGKSAHVLLALSLLVFAAIALLLTTYSHTSTDPGAQQHRELVLRLAARTEYLFDRGGRWLTYEYKFGEGFLVRTEWLRDFSTRPFFFPIRWES